MEMRLIEFTPPQNAVGTLNTQPSPNNRAESFLARKIYRIQNGP